MHYQSSISTGMCSLPGISGLLSGQLPSLDASANSSQYFGRSSTHYTTPPTPTPSPVNQTDPKWSCSQTVLTVSQAGSPGESKASVPIYNPDSSTSSKCSSTTTSAMSSPHLKRALPAHYNNLPTRIQAHKRKQWAPPPTPAGPKRKTKTRATPKDPGKASIERQRRFTQTRLIGVMESDIERWDMPMTSNPLSRHNSNESDLKYPKIATLSTHVIGARVMEKRLRFLGAEIVPKMREARAKEPGVVDLAEFDKVMEELERVACRAIVDDVDVEELNGLQELVEVD